MAALDRHIPELALDWAASAPERQWQRVEGTLCFADISGFTSLAERLSRRGRVGGEELITTLNRVFGPMLDCAREYDGMLLKFGGDALLFLFTGPDHALRAASAAVVMRSALRIAAEQPTSVGRIRLSMSVGLHSGALEFFLVGGSHRELVLVGPQATAAADCEAAANAGEIAATESTAAVLPADAIRAREDGLRLLRWRQPAVTPNGSGLSRTYPDELAFGLFPERLGHYLAKQVPEPEHRVACIAFARFSGTDRLLLDAGPDAVAAALNDTLGAAQGFFDTEQVTLLAVDLDRDGGKLFLGSGVPFASEDDEARMLRALRRLVTAKLPLPIQAGVNRGHVFAVEVGTPWRAAYSAMGDTTNTAARICAKAPPGNLYAHPGVLDYSRTRFATEAVGPFRFKGKKAPQVVYAVGELQGRRYRTTREVELPFTGRREELELLGGRVRAAQAGQGGVVCVTGPPGIGKSQLAREATRFAPASRVISLRAEPYGEANPYRVFRDPLRALLRIERGDPKDRGRQLAERIAELHADSAELAALLDDVLDVELAESPTVAAIETQFRPARIAELVIRLIGAARPGPLILLMEDAQWADEASLELLARIAAASAEQGWLLIAVQREAGGLLAELADECLELQPLQPDDLAELIKLATDAAPLRPHEIDFVVRRAAGNPLFALEMIRTARNLGSFDSVPDSLEAMVASQVDSLDPDARLTLRFATVLGRSCRRGVLAALLESEGHQLDAATLDRLSGFIVRDGEDRLRFRNGLLRKAAYESLSYRLRARLHRVAGETMEAGVDDPLVYAADLARHFSRGDDMPRTWKYARLAGDRSRRSYANADAARLYRTALDAAADITDLEPDELQATWTRLGDSCDAAAMFDDALKAYRRAARIAVKDKVAAAELLLRRAYVRDRMGAFPMALRELTRGRKLIAEERTDAAEKLRARLSSFSAMIRFAQEHFQQCLDVAETAMAEARAAGDEAALAEALVAAGSANESLGQPRPEQMQEALQIYQRLGELSSEANVRGNLGCSAYFAGDWDGAIDWWESQREICRKAGNSVGEATAASNIGEVLVKRGHLEQAEPMLRDAVRTMRAAGFHDGAAYAEIQHGRALLKRGDAAAAAELLERVRREFAEYGQAASVLETAIVLALALTVSGRGEEALAQLDEAVDAAGADAQLFMPLVDEARARALASLERIEDARSAVERGLASAREFGLAYEEAILLRTRAQLVAKSGGEADARDLEVSQRILGGLGAA